MYIYGVCRERKERKRRAGFVEVGFRQLTDSYKYPFPDTDLRTNSRMICIERERVSEQLKVKKKSQ